VNCRFLKPIDEGTLQWALAGHDTIVTIEECTIVNGFGASLALHIEQARRERPALRHEIMGVPDRIIEHANRDQQLAEAGIDAEGIAARVRSLVMSAAAPRVHSA